VQFQPLPKRFGFGRRRDNVLTATVGGLA
jgi:hypothetical protein